ncbi:hypothetical protein [Pseudoxanthomonas suwonensis]|uniref:Secreted protein n=1 Tax=Pseudoxanthomonas suwonensis TaxID=314722 RepID=A0A0E3YZF9_9GAMM|nr:hypothetical protein [Pseudoxanthomonas suwonensis]AKC85404.1 hypothetical protein WQ53_00045 [Pseudoxanthomonas suwonensis]
MKLRYLMLLCALPAQAAAACMFTSNMAPFPADTSALVDNARIPAPEIASSSLVRGAGGGATCDALGFVSVQLRWPRGSDYSLDQIGFEYRVVVGEAPEGLFPGTVLASPVSGRRAEHQFIFQDLPPAQQRPLDLVLEVRAVTPDRQRGAPARFVLGR